MKMTENPIAPKTKMAFSSLPETHIFGCKIHRVSMEEAVDHARDLLRDGQPHHIVTADSSMLVMAMDDPDLRDIINASDLVVPDSTGVVWASQRVGEPVPERVTGVDLMERLCELGSRIGLTAYFLGSAPGVAEEAAQKLEARYPGFKVVGSHHGFLQPGDIERIEAEIQSLQPHMLFVAMGIPKQEKWIRDRLQLLGVPLSMGVGGSLDCHSGRVQRAPKIFQKLWIEWLYRLIKNPKKYQKVALLPRFALKVLTGKGRS